MAAKFVVLVALVVLAHSSVVPVARVDTEQNSFAYDVADPNTGDYKSQVETRVGGNVVGQYSLLQPDGTRRVVDYTADDVNGFNAVVRNDAPVVTTPVVASAPVVASPGVPPVSLAATYPVVTSDSVVVDSRAVPRIYAAQANPSFYSSVLTPSLYSSIVSPSVYFYK